MQDAKIGDLFDNFPPVLQLHLKRFEYDFERDVRVKVRATLPRAIQMQIQFCLDHKDFSVYSTAPQTALEPHSSRSTPLHRENSQQHVGLRLLKFL